MRGEAFRAVDFTPVDGKLGPHSQFTNGDSLAPPLDGELGRGSGHMLLDAWSRDRAVVFLKDQKIMFDGK